MFPEDVIFQLAEAEGDFMALCKTCLPKNTWAESAIRIDGAGSRPLVWSF